MRRGPLYTSVGLHVVILIVAAIGLPFLAHREFTIPPPVTVDVEIGKIAQTTRVAPPQPAPPKPELPKPAPAPTNLAPQPQSPVKEPPKPEEKVEKPEKPTPELDENAPPKKDKKPVKKEPPKKAPPQRDFSSVLKNLDVKKDQPAPAPAQNTPIGEKMTMTEEDALRAQLEKCWNVPVGAKDVDNMSVDIFMTVNPDRTLRDAKIVDTSRYNSDPFFRTLADSAIRAVRNPLCSPFELPPDKYNTWNQITVTFNPKDMF